MGSATFEKLKAKSLGQSQPVVDTSVPTSTPTISTQSPHPRMSAFDALKQKQTAQPVQTSQDENKGSVLGNIAKAIVKPVATTLARPIQLGAELVLPGDNTESIDKFSREKLGGLVAPVPQSGRDVVKDVGRGIETVSYGLGVGAVPKIFKGSKVLQGAFQGAKFGAIGGAGAGLAEEGTIASTAEGAATGALLGGAFGGALGGISKSAQFAKQKLTDKSTRKMDEISLLKERIPDTRVLTKKLQDGRVVSDNEAQKAIRVGVPNDAVIMAKSASPSDASAMQKMIDIREKQLTNPRLRATNRASRVVGKTFVDRVKFVAQKNREAGEKLGRVAESLAGKKVNITQPLNDFVEQLQTAGVKFDRNGNITKTGFKGSVFDFPGGRSTQQTIREMWMRAKKLARNKDALAAHRMKTAIDQTVDYGKRIEGLGGKAQNILKQFRRGLDTQLDTQFDVYNKVNQDFALTIRQLEDVAKAMGRKFKVGDNFADLDAGKVLGRIDSNARSGTEILSLLDDLENTAKAYGMKTDEDLVTQTLFNSKLEKIMGPEGDSSFFGRLETVAERAGEAGQIAEGLTRGGIVGGITKAGLAGLRAARGVNQKNQIEALKALLGRNTIKTNIGR